MLGHLVEHLVKRDSLGRRKCLKQYFRRFTRPAWLGTIRRTTPLSNLYGCDRGTPIDRFYIERFIDEHRREIQGHVLEVKDSGYTDRYGTNVEHCDVLDIDPANPNATIIADLAAAEAVASDQFDCFLLTQTLQFIYDLRGALVHCRRILRPDGVLLVTVPAVGRIFPNDTLISPDYWRFTASSCSSLFGEVFGPEHVTVRSYGNVLTAIAFLTGLAYEELSRRELDANDSNFPLIISIRAIKQ
jgi:SAM-dependent methyltransferase